MGNKQKKEGSNMGTICKPQEAMVVKKGMTKAFMEMLSSSKVTKAYWDECADANRDLSVDNIEKLKKICNGEK